MTQKYKPITIEMLNLDLVPFKSVKYENWNLISSDVDKKLEGELNEKIIEKINEMINKERFSPFYGDKPDHQIWLSHDKYIGNESINWIRFTYPIFELIKVK